MSSTRRMWRTVAIASLLSAALFAAGFGYAARTIFDPASAAGNRLAIREPDNPETSHEGSLAAKPKINVVALGDSLTAGTGDITGQGYVNRVKNKLAIQFGKPAYVLNNLAVPGYRTDQLLAQLADKPVQDAVREADIVLLTIGANDITQGTDASGQSMAIDYTRAETNLPGASKRLGDILAKLSEVNPNALIVYSALYYPYLDVDKERQGPPIVEAFNQSAFLAANKWPNVVVVPTYDLFALGGTKYLYTDHYHPNGDGYERIAERIAQVLK
ncbi:hypothetical protein SD70_16185 [Gordoniibacillus kamchatkensis]|uniref:SGNH hydrolase-type esterase domain-containing protein n=1 Tax=Gordoniibacillus kamchatkensis TaxID=1590651 RepID=A0ABR5AI76_9BACL|nr:GDSL-type esterase/lipase family protein [Paenibacillus sp. VKM B-2647]KIL40062.1 hypothetical protein SD70_16185 [Paenibacillus sp. VKM B-2647]